VGDVGRGVGGDVGRGVVSIVRQSVGGGVEHGVGGLAAFSILVPWISLKVWHQIREQQKHENSIKTLSEQKNRPKVRNSTKASSLISEKNHTLPQWILNYITWHRRIRAEFPGSQLFHDPNAPPLLIRTCLGLCGGLNDRLGQLPWDLYLANQTGRILWTDIDRSRWNTF